MRFVAYFRHLAGVILKALGGVNMDKVLPIVIICGVGIGLAFAYIVFVLVRALMQRRNGDNPRNEFEIDDNTLTVKLGKKRKKK